jgi:hypothetical protein
MTRTRLWLAVIIAVVALGLLLTWRLWSRSSNKVYDTPELAVTTACHAANILGEYTSGSTNIRIGWQEKGQAEGVGWTALVVRDNGGYRVENCKFQVVLHG